MGPYLVFNLSALTSGSEHQIGPWGGMTQGPQRGMQICTKLTGFIGNNVLT